MIADAVHSLSDFVTDILVLVFVSISAKPQDRSHDYGHGKYETLATTLIGIALSAVAIGIGYKAVTAFLYWLQGGMLAAPGMLALWAAMVSIAIKELVYHYTVHKGRVLNSPAVEANAWHHRSDALSSIGTLVGIGGAIVLGKRWTVLDPLASLVVSFFIMRVAWKLLKQGLDELMEASLPEEVESEILAIVNTFPDVQDPHHLRTRRIGSRYAIELHIRMDGSLPLSTAHARTCEIEQALKAHFGPTTHITLHVEPLK
jgi:cation diffusion facilitator family transporter